MAMQYNGTQQTINLRHLEQGQFMSIVISGAPGNCVLEFLHVEDETWRAHPGFVGTVTGGVLVERLVCISGYMRIRFLAAPETPYNLSIVFDARPSF